MPTRQVSQWNFCKAANRVSSKTQTRSLAVRQKKRKIQGLDRGFGNERATFAVISEI
jgi:hypothetical protein